MEIFFNWIIAKIASLIVHSARILDDRFEIGSGDCLTYGKRDSFSCLGILR